MARKNIFDHWKFTFTIRTSKQASGVHNAHCALYYVRKKLHYVSWKRRKEKVVFLACEFSPSKIHLSDYPKSLISRKKWSSMYFQWNMATAIFYWQKNKRLFCYSHTCYCVNMVSVTSASCYIKSASRFHPRYQSRSSSFICGLIPRDFADLAEAVPNVEIQWNNHDN